MSEKIKTCCLLLEKGRYIIEFIQNFMECDWKEELKEENIQLVSLEESRGKLLYNIKLKNKNIFFYLWIISKNVNNIHLDILQDMTQIWKKYQANGIPQIVPCVLYIGKRKEITADFASKFSVHKEFSKYIPDFNLEIIDINDYSDDDLLSLGNVVGSVFYFNKGRGEKERQKRLKQTLELIGKVNADKKEELVELYKETETIINKMKKTV